MENKTQPTQPETQEVQIPVELAAQMQFQQSTNLVQFKIKLLELSIDLYKTDSSSFSDIRETYLELREEVLGFPNPNSNSSTNK